MIIMVSIQESVESLLASKAEEMGRVLTSREEEYVRLQVERNEIVTQFPHSESRGNEVLKSLQRIKNRIKKLAKGRPADDVLKLPLRSAEPKTAAERTSAKRKNMSKDARDREKEDDRKRKASPEELEKAKKRMKTPEQLEKAKKRMKTPEQLERGRERKKTPEELERGRERKKTPEELERGRKRKKTPEQLEKAKERMKTPEQLERGRERKKTPEELERGRERKKTPEQLDKAKERMSLPVNRDKDAARKKEKRRLHREEKEKRDECPKAPAMRRYLNVMFPTDDMCYKIEHMHLYSRMDEDIFWRDPPVEGPTYSLDQPLRIRALFTCYPPPTIVWLKNGKVLARDTVKYALKEGVNEISDCQKERIAPEFQLRFQVESYYRFKLPGCIVPVAGWNRCKGSFLEPEWTAPMLMQEGWSDFIIQEPKLIDEGVYEVRIFNSYGVVDDFIEVRTCIENIVICISTCHTQPGCA